MHNYQKNTNLFGNFPKRHIPSQTDGMIRFYSNLVLQTFAPRVFHSVLVRTLTERHKQTQSNAVNKQKSLP